MLPRRERLCAAEAYDRSFLRARRLSPGPTRRPRRARNSRRSSSARTRSSGTQIGVAAPAAVGDRDVPAGRRDARELVEERDHVVQRHQLERAVRRTAARTHRRRRSAASASSRGGAPRSIIPAETSAPTTSASGQRAATSRATAPLPGAEVEHGARAAARRASSAARIAPSETLVRRASRPIRARAGRSSRVSGRAEDPPERGHAHDDRRSRAARTAGRASRLRRSGSRRRPTTPVSRAASPRLIASVMKP